MNRWLTAPPLPKWFFQSCLFALIVVALVSGWRALISYDDSNSLYLSISLKSHKEGVTALYYDMGKGFNESHVVSAFIKGDNQVYDYRYKIPNKTIYRLRWDPPPVTHDPITIQKIEILDNSFRLVKRLGLHQLAPLHQIESLKLSGEQAEILIQRGADDPQVDLRLEPPLFVRKYHILAKIIGWFLFEFIGFSLIACLLIYLWLRRKDKIIESFRQRNKLIILATVICLMLFGWRCWILYNDVGYLFVQVTMSSSVNGHAKIYFDLGHGLNEDQSQQVQVSSQKELTEYRFKLPNKTINKIRFDPLATAGRIRIGDMKVIDSFGNLLRVIPIGQLEPIHQIESINARDDGVEIIISANANDPQIAIPLNGPLDFEGKLPFPMRQWLMSILTELCLFILIALGFIHGKRKKWGNLLLEGIESPFFQEKMPILYLGTALGLILAMGVISGLDVHPDEWNGHIKAAAYYILNWLPPAVDDPRIVNSISVFGVSNLWVFDPIYFVAAKASQVFSFIVPDFYLRVRLANAFLFLLLVLVVASQIERLKWIVPLLVISPQVWYVFSYFNNDGFALFIAILLAMQVSDSESFLNRFFTAPLLRQHIGGGILAGILAGIILISKLNYFIYIVFLIFVGLWVMLFDIPRSLRILRLQKLTFVASIALLVYLPIFGYDLYVNDFKKDEKVSQVMEHYAAPQFKLSKLQNDLSSTYPGLRLRDKGVSLVTLLIKNPDWRDLSFKSFFGIYGYMDLVSPPDYYRILTYTLGLFFVIILSYVAFALSFRDIIFILFVLLFMGLAVGQSVYHSWVNDFQPQGRYLFPILPMLIIGLAKLPDSFRTRVMPLFGLAFFLLSVWSFLLTGLRVIPKID